MGGASVWLAALLMVGAGLAWQWRTHLPSSRLEASASTGVEQATLVYPLPSEEVPLPSPSGITPEAIIKANPFSTTRGEPPPSDHPSDADAAQAARPKFVYKGQIAMGDRQRAIVQDSTSGKTYFLEVGQEVAGFKVLDITHDQVVLSETDTHTIVTVLRKTAVSGDAKP